MNSLKSAVILLFLCLVACVGDVYGEQTNSSWNGDWVGTTPEGDMTIELTLDLDNKKNLNPHNAESLCNGFMSVYIVEPSGGKSLLSTYELQFDKSSNYVPVFTFKGGREGVDNASGKCEALLANGKFNFHLLQNEGDDALFDKVTFSKKTATVVQKKNTIGDYLSTILILLVYFGIIGHMVYVFFKGDRYKTQFTVAGMVAQRTEQGKPSEMSEDEYNQCVNLLESAFCLWSIDGQTENGEELRKPKKMKQIKSSAMYIDQAIALQPTEQDIIDRINELTEVINSNEKRYFDGSKPLVWLGIIVGILFGFIMGWGTAALTLISTGCYILASRTPAFLVEKRANRGGGNIHNGMIAGIFGMIAGAQTIRTITTYSDGHKEYSDDHSQHWIAWILGLCLLVAIAAFMALWALVNYLRNYVFYF